MLQDTNKRLQEYNTSLQQYNSNLQADATKNAETIAKLQKEKNTMVETMNGLKDHANSVKMQLDMVKVRSLLHLSVCPFFVHASFIGFVYRELS